MAFTQPRDQTLAQHCISSHEQPNSKQGRSWYTKWLTVVERSPVVTRFDTREFLDIGGFVNIRLRMDDDKMNGYMYQVG